MMQRLPARFAQLFDVPENVPRVEGGTTQLESVLQIVFSVIAVISVLIIVIAGLSYVLSGGDPQRTSRAKDAILYAVIGLVISMTAFAIVGFVAGRAF